MSPRVAVLISCVAGFILLCIFWSFGVQHWIAWYTGAYNCPASGCPGGSAHNYNFWSGFGSDLAEYAVATGLIGSAFAVWRSNTCHATWWCWRRPLHQLGESPYKVCHIHHPEDIPSFKQVMTDCKEYVEGLKTDV